MHHVIFIFIFFHLLYKTVFFLLSFLFLLFTLLATSSLIYIINDDIIREMRNALKSTNSVISNTVQFEISQTYDDETWKLNSIRKYQICQKLANIKDQSISDELKA